MNNKANATSFKKGHAALPGSEKGWFKRGVHNNVNADHPHWRGEKASYSSKHKWVRRKRGSAKQCADCGTTDGRIEWSNRDHKYRRVLSDYTARCKSCHTKYDLKKGLR